MKNIAIIPARSGSKGLKDKNIRELNGKPLIAYAIEGAIQSGKFEEVMVSTDSKVYADIAIKYGASVPFLRSDEHSSDTASSWDVVREVLDFYKKNGQSFDSFTLLQPTSPLRSAKDIEGAYKVFEDKNAKSVISVCEVDHSPLLSGVLGDEGSLDGFISQKSAGRRQAMKTYHRLNGAIYIVDMTAFYADDFLYNDGCFAYIMDKKNSVDIDTIDDFMYAEFLLNKA